MVDANKGIEDLHSEIKEIVKPIIQASAFKEIGSLWTECSKPLSSENLAKNEESPLKKPRLNGVTNGHILSPKEKA